jgi:hypothetical protein
LTLSTSAGTPTITVNGFANPSTSGVTISAAITGAQGLNKAGTGLLILTTGIPGAGGTTISGGTLQIGAGARGATLGPAARSPTMARSRSTSRMPPYSVADNISGTGNITKAGDRDAHA